MRNQAGEQPPGIDDYLSIPEAATYSGVVEQTIRNAVSDGRLPSVKKFGKNLVKRADMDAYKQRTQPEGVPRVGRPRKDAGALTPSEESSK